MGNSTATASPKNTLAMTERTGESREHLLAELGLSPTFVNASTARGFAKPTVGELDLTECLAVMRHKASAVNSGNLSGLEDVLTAQTVVLDKIFNEMARRAALNMGEHLNATEIYMRLALKAQTQCRSTVQTLFEMKNPQPIAFVRQANIANGPQQVNNRSSAVAPSPPREGNPAIEANELLELNHEQRLDAGTAGAAGGTDCHLETVGAVERSQE